MSAEIKGPGMECRCPYCSQLIQQGRNLSGPNFCSKCCKLFYPPPESKTPPWVMGVLAVLMANLQISMNVAGIV